jgi:hypothetical protein
MCQLGTTLAGTGNLSTLQRNIMFLVIVNVLSSPIVVTLLMEAIRSSETMVSTRATRRNAPEDGILHSYRRENRKSYLDGHLVTEEGGHGCFAG